MAQTVKNIVDNAETIIASVLGSPWKKLRYVWDLDKNDERDAKKAYGVKPGPAENEASVTLYETLSQSFDFVLSDTVARGDSDDEIQAILDVLYDKADLIFKQFVNLKMNLTTTVLKVDERSMEGPILSGDKVFLRVPFVVRYRQSL